MQTPILLVAATTLLLVSGCSMLESIGSPFSSRSDDNFNRRVYVGVGGGLSRVAPDTSASTQFSLDDSSSTAAAIIAGVDFSERISFELQATDLGAAVLSPPEEVSYSAIGAAGLFYALGNIDSISQRRGFAGFLRAGINLMSHESDIALDREDNAQVWLGLGADYFLASNFALRAELAAQDTDSQSAQLAVLYRFGASNSDRDSGRPRVVSPTPSVPAATPPSTPQVQRYPVPQPQTQPPAQPQAQPQIQQQIPATPRPVPAPSANPASRLLADGVLTGVDFIPGTAQLSGSSSAVLDSLARELIANPGVRVELQSHADASSGQAQAMQMTRARVLRVGKYLISRGVASSQLGARAFGASQPLGGQPSAADNRIELRIR